MKKDITRLFIALFLFLWVATVHGSVYAAFLKFDQASYDLEVGDTFDVQIIVNPGTEEVTSIDSYVKYGSSVINATGVTEGSYFPTVLNDLTSGKVYIAGLVDSPSDFKSGTGTVATITFEALKNSHRSCEKANVKSRRFKHNLMTNLNCSALRPSSKGLNNRSLASDLQRPPFSSEAKAGPARK